MIAGWAWVIFGALIGGDQRSVLLVLAILPSVLWLAAGATGAIIFEVGGIGPRVLTYWESYVIIVVFSLLGVVALRLALLPREGRIYRPAPPETL